MSSAIDATKPTATTALTADVRANETATKLEINELHRITEDMVVAGGTVDALTADFTTNVVLANGVIVCIQAAGANTSATPTLNVDGTGVKTITKEDNAALVAGDIAGAGHRCLFQYDSTNTTWRLINPSVAAASSGAIDHDATLNFVANEHVDHTAVSVIAGSGLSGGGTLAASRTLAIDINSLTTGTPDLATDTVAFYDVSAADHKKVSLSSVAVPAASRTATGHIKLADGTIINYGTVSITSTTNGTTNEVALTFSLPFTTSVFAVTATPLMTSGALSNGTLPAYYRLPTTTSVNIGLDREGVNGSVTATVSVIAIGY